LRYLRGNQNCLVYGCATCVVCCAVVEPRPLGWSDNWTEEEIVAESLSGIRPLSSRLAVTHDSLLNALWNIKSKRILRYNGIYTLIQNIHASLIHLPSHSLYTFNTRYITMHQSPTAIVHAQTAQDAQLVNASSSSCFNPNCTIVGVPGTTCACGAPVV
jgi:hypothetical protein